MGKKEMRMNRLVEIINSRGYIPIKEIAQLLHVSEMTVRRDLAAVEKSGLVKNVNGVLVSNSGNTVQVLDKEYDLLNETQVQNEVKKLIGRFAATMIVPGDCVFLTPAPPQSRLRWRFLRKWISRHCVSPVTHWRGCAVSLM